MFTFVCEKNGLAKALERITVTVSRKAYIIPTENAEEKRAAKSRAGEDIQNELKNSPNVIECDVNGLAESMGTGHCVRGIIHEPQNSSNSYTDIKGKNHIDTSKAFIRQTVFLLDFDNKSDPPREEFQTADGVREFINKTISEQIGQPVNAVSVVSESVSSSAELRKWHAALVLETPIEEYNRAKQLITFIVNDIFSDIADGACTDPARLIFGGTPEQTTKAYNGYLTDEVVNALEEIINRKAEERRAKAAEQAAQRAKAIKRAKANGIDTSMKVDRLASIILCSPCNFGKGNKEYYRQWLSACTALYHIAGIPSDVIQVWSEGYDGTYQNPAQWENYRGGKYTEGTLKWAAELLNPMEYNAYKHELNAQLKPKHKNYFSEKAAKNFSIKIKGTDTMNDTAMPIDWNDTINEPADTETKIVTPAEAAAALDEEPDTEPVDGAAPPAEIVESDSADTAEHVDVSSETETAAEGTDTTAEIVAAEPSTDQSENGTEAAEPAANTDTQSEEITEPPDIESLTKEDIVHGKVIYDYIIAFLDKDTGEIDEIGLADYRRAIEDKAKELGCKDVFAKSINAYSKQLKKYAKEIKNENARARFAARRDKTPDWVIISPNDGANKIDENKFSDYFVCCHGEIRCINNTFYDIDGELPRKRLESMVYDRIFPYISQNVAFRARALCDTLALRCYSEPIKPDRDKVHVSNGTLIYKADTYTDTDGSEKKTFKFEFSPNKEFCLCRMNVEFTDTFRRPDKWHAFLDDLLDYKDQLTLQEYMGYCLLPITSAQKSLFIIGQGGEGKSVIGTIMNAIFGTGMVSKGVHKLDNGSGARFARADLIGRLVMVDDDIKLGALEDTDTFKQIVTARTPIEVEEKGVQPYQAWIYSRIIAFGNGALSSLYDNSDGFWRRQLILSAKPKDPNRVDNPDIEHDLLTEKDLIFNWALRGLERLMKNNYKFTLSERTKQNLEEQRIESNSIIPFMESGEVKIDGDRSRCITSADLYKKYDDWCAENVLHPKTSKTFVKYLRENADKYHIEYSTNVPDDGKRRRGFVGIGDMSPIPPSV